MQRIVTHLTVPHGSDSRLLLRAANLVVTAEHQHRVHDCDRTLVVLAYNRPEIDPPFASVDVEWNEEEQRHLVMVSREDSNFVLGKDNEIIPVLEV